MNAVTERITTLFQFVHGQAGKALPWVDAAAWAIGWRAPAKRRLPPQAASTSLPVLVLLVAGLALCTPSLADGVARQDSAPMASLLWSLRAMVGSWIVLMLVVCVLVWRGPSMQGTRGRFALWACVLTLPLPWIAMISGWLVLELGQPTPPGAAVQAAHSEGSNAATLFAWGCAYAVLMIMNMKLSLRWMRNDPAASDAESSRSRRARAARHKEPHLEPPRASTALVERLAHRYQVGEPHTSPGSRDEPAMLTDLSQSRGGEVDKLKRSLARLRKERNALRKVLKIKRKGPDKGARAAPRSSGSRSGSRRADGPDRPDTQQDTQQLPVLSEVLPARRS